MPASAKLAAFAVGTLTAFGAAFGLGRAVGPVGGTDDGPAHPSHATATTSTIPADPHAGHAGNGEGANP